ERGEENVTVLAGAGCYSRLTGTPKLETELYQAVHEAFERRDHHFLPQRSGLYMKTRGGPGLVALLGWRKEISDTDRALIEIFGSRISAAFDNVMLYGQLQEANAHLEERVRLRTRELQQANNRLSAQGTRLQRANTFKSEVLEIIAHDLK